MIVRQWIPWDTEAAMPYVGNLIYPTVMSGTGLGPVTVRRLISLPLPDGSERDFVELEYDDPDLDE